MENKIVVLSPQEIEDLANGKATDRTQMRVGFYLQFLEAKHAEDIRRLESRLEQLSQLAYKAERSFNSAERRALDALRNCEGLDELLEATSAVYRSDRNDIEPDSER
jgi:hypothetical protein